MHSSSEPQITFLHLHALNLFGSWSNVCKNGQLSTCQTPAQVTCAHFQRSSESASAPHPFASFPSPPKRPREPHIIGSFSLPSTPFFDFFLVAGRVAGGEKILHSEGFRRFRQHPFSCFDHLRFGFFRSPWRGPRIIGELPNPSTPQRVFCFLRRAFLRTSLRGPRIIGWLRNPSTPCAFFFSFAPRSCERRCEGRGLCMAATPLGRP